MGTHAWFVLTDPTADTDRVVLVALVTERAHTDRTTFLDVGDHPFVRHASNVDYGTATFAPASKLTSKLIEGVASLDADMSAELLQRVREGLLVSSRTPNDVAVHVREQLNR